VGPGDDGEIWFGAEQMPHLYHVARGKVEDMKVSRELAAFAYTAPDKTIWLGGLGGLWKMDRRGHLVQVPLTPKMTSQIPFLQSITRGRGGGMWVSLGRYGFFQFAEGGV